MRGIRGMARRQIVSKIGLQAGIQLLRFKVGAEEGRKRVSSRISKNMILSMAHDKDVYWELEYKPLRL
jgi:hypothetical protein